MKNAILSLQIKMFKAFPTENKGTTLLLTEVILTSGTTEHGIRAIGNKHLMAVTA